MHRYIHIPADNVYLQTKYRDLLCDVEAVKDNAGLMAIKFFAQIGVHKIWLAGLMAIPMMKKKIMENLQWHLLRGLLCLMQ